ncbi:hypothetical protein D3C77_567100 [compost metagenome]
MPEQISHECEQHYHWPQHHHRRTDTVITNIEKYVVFAPYGVEHIGRFPPGRDGQWRQVVVTRKHVLFSGAFGWRTHVCSVCCVCASNSASRWAIAASSSGERLAHCSGGRGLDHSMMAG